MSRSPSLPSSEVLAAWGLAGAEVTAIEIGNINRTYGVHDAETGRRYILQSVNRIFPPEVNDDIQAVTEHLTAKGMPTPRLVPVEHGRLWFSDQAGEVWRLQTFVEGINRSQVESPGMAYAAGALLGRFHQTLADLDHAFRGRRTGVHDTAAHAAHLREAIASRCDHPAHGRAAALAERILRGLDRLPALEGLPARVVHGDPKINNLIFDEQGRGVCLIDLDTVARMPIPVELGDAFRSWCNPRGEDAAEARFDLESFEAALRGYAGEASDMLSAAEIDAITTGIETITLELAARFCADGVEESYFGWNRERFAAAWEHHLLRAEGQLHLAESFAAERPRADAIVASLLGERAP